MHLKKYGWDKQVCLGLAWEQFLSSCYEDAAVHDSQKCATPIHTS